ncbi:MAG: ABC transporter ATP-binding protein [Chloroflexota bacterium]
MTDAAIEFRDVDAGYGGRRVLSGVVAAVAPGERVAIVGPNGAGKSTLLRLLTGVLAPARGDVLLQGERVRELSRIAVARRVAVVPQVAALPFSARVEEVVALGRLPHEDPLRGPRAVDRAAVDAAILRVGISGLVGRDARELSLGERQLVLVAVAIAQAAPIVVLDEPTVHLDIRHQVDVMELLLDLNRRDGTTIVAVLHDLALAARYFPRILVVGGGRIAVDGPPSEALSRERVRAVFQVDPWMFSQPWAAAPDETTGVRP